MRRNKNNRLTIRLDNKRYNKLTKIAEKTKISKQQVIRYLIDNKRFNNSINRSQMDKVVGAKFREANALNKIHSDLFRLGNNINQQVKMEHINGKTSKLMSAKDIRWLLGDLKRLDDRTKFLSAKENS